MVGVGVVTLFTVFAASLKASVDQHRDAVVPGDLVIGSGGQFGGGGSSPALATDVAALPEVGDRGRARPGRPRLVGRTTPSS